MKKTVLTMLVLTGMFSLVAAQDLDQILSLHARTMGYGKLTSVKTMKISGKTLRGSNDVPFTIYVKGDKFRYESDFMGRKMVQVYDGNEGWMISPRSGEVQQMPERMVPMLRQRTGVLNPLVNWKEIKQSLTLEGKVDFEGTTVYKIKYTRQDGSVSRYFIDTENYVLLKETNELRFNGNTMMRSVLYSDYKPVDGILVAFSRRNVSEGGPAGQGGRPGGMRGGGETRYDKVEFNVPVDDTLFTKASLQ